MKQEKIAPVLEKARQDPAVLAVILFGSQARGDAHGASDVDLCLVLEPDQASRADQRAVRETYLPYVTEQVDIHVFQELPLFLRRRVLKEGRVLSCRDEDRLYDVAYRMVRDFERYRPYYDRYLEEVARAGS